MPYIELSCRLHGVREREAFPGSRLSFDLPV